jgi:chemotaxis methyl-accepting protein methylase
VTDFGPNHSLPLAHGDLSPADVLELQALKDQISRDIGFHCDSYKEQCLRRRIAVRMRARGVHSYAAYAGLLARDDSEHRKLLDAITINVSKFYRNPELWRALELHVAPRLFESPVRPVRIWSAGCAAGEEPYTIAMMLKEYALRNNRERELADFRVLGTDVDPESLHHARVGRYGAFSFTDMPDEVRRAWFLPPAFTEIKPEIRSFVQFERKDLIKDDLERGQHMIVCRNVIIYFERAIQEQLFAKFHDALAPGGLIVLGKVETMFGRATALFKPVLPRERVFVKQ